MTHLVLQSPPRSLSTAITAGRPVLAFVSLIAFLGACDPASPSPAPADDGATTGTDPATTEAPGDTGETVPPEDPSTDDGSNDDASAEESTSGEEPPPEETTGGEETGEPEPTDCTAPQVVPKPPVDCSGADGVLQGSAIIEDGNDAPEILVGIRRVEGSIRINRQPITDLDFMACVEEVEGDVTIFGNESLTNVDGLWSLQSIGTDFVFSENTAIVDVDGLPNVSSVTENLVIKNNDSLESISGFHSLEGVGNNLLIQNNDALLEVDGLGGLQSVGGVFAITANPSLCISSVNCVGVGIVDPAVPPAEWSTQANDNGC